MSSDPDAVDYAYAQWIRATQEDYEAQCEELSLACRERDKAQEELAQLKRTREFSEAEYLKGHGGSWGICKYQARCRELEHELDAIRERTVKMRLALGQVDACFQGRDADGCPSAEGTYWVGHQCAIMVWYALNPEKEPKDKPGTELPF